MEAVSGPGSEKKYPLQFVEVPKVNEIPFNEARELLHNAFLPLRCVVEAHLYRDQVSFRVYGANGNPLYTSEKLSAKSICKLTFLNDVILRARFEVKATGAELEKWVEVRGWC